MVIVRVGVSLGQTWYRLEMQSLTGRLDYIPFPNSPTLCKVPMAFRCKS